MNSGKILYSKGGNDECITPAYAVTPIIKYIEAGLVVWCPFDHRDSNFVREISAWNDVIPSHIDEGKDFYNYQPNYWDVIVSNPPFTRKRQIFERALSFNMPFALLMSNTWLNDSAPKQLFKDKDLQLLMFDKRVHYERNGVTDRKTTFSSSYYCWDMLPKQIIMEELHEPR